ncbi:MAG: 16S rRNA (guanine(527)-N(7))-methyltransferase RsmG [Actinomycetota bacterium]
MIEGSAEGDGGGLPRSQGPVSRETRTPEPADLLAAGARAGVGLSEEASSELRRFEELLRERALPTGLVATADAGRLWERHILDSLRAVRAVRPGDVRALDLGSGAGLPGVVVAIARPSLRVVLVEPRRARVAFLELAVEHLRLSNVSVLAARIEDVDEQVDLCFSRAFAPLPRAWRVAAPRLRQGGRLVYFAGAGAGPPETPSDASAVEVLESPLLESSGPLFIMTR